MLWLSFVVIDNWNSLCLLNHFCFVTVLTRCLGSTTIQCCVTSRHCRPSQALSRHSGGNMLCCVNKNWSSAWKLNTGGQNIFPHVLCFITLTCNWRLTILQVTADSLLSLLHLHPIIFVIHVGLYSGLWMSWKNTRSNTTTTSTSRRPWTSTSCFRKSRYFGILSTKLKWPKKPSWVWQHSSSAFFLLVRFQPSISSFLAAEIYIVQIAVNLLHLFSLRCILLVKSWVMELICCISLAVYQDVMCNFLGNVHWW